MESLIKSKNTMAEIRLTARFPQLKIEFKETMEKVVNLVNSRLKKMQLKGTGLTTYQGATESAVDNFSLRQDDRKSIHVTYN